MLNIKKVHPGIIIKESLDALNMTAKEFSMRTGISERTLSSIINGKGDITFDVAYKLAQYFDNSVIFWTNLQTQYNIYLHEIEEQKLIDNEWDLAKCIRKYLIENNYISKDDKKIDIICKCRELAGVNSLELLNTKDSFVCLKKHNIERENEFFYQNFWLALALKESRKISCDSYNKNLLLSYINEIRSMSLTEPNIFMPRLKQIFEKCGISFVVLPYLAKSNIYGATKWFNKENCMLAISNRSGKCDLFWFTLFHEISHVLMEHKRESLINIGEVEDFDANMMAQNFLIPKNEWDEFVKSKGYSKDKIVNFASKVGVHPCIVLGRLYKENYLAYNTFSTLYNIKYDFN